jgi:putative zinc- or iron-chelating protein
VTHRYLDPLAQVWLGAARRIGLGVVRTPDAYAATDGRGTLAIGGDAALDADDSLAQMIFHELCHSLVEGEASFARADWGMDNTGPDHDWREHACLRVQWVLAGRHGLRAVFAPTTDFRAFWDQLAGDVLADRSDPSVGAAIAGLRRVALPPWAPALEDALTASAQIAAAAARFASAAPVAAEPPPGPAPPAGTAAAPLRSLWLGATSPPARHPTGLPAGAAGATCGACAWRAGTRCRQAGARVDPAWPSCERFEAALDCQTCGACCRAAYHSVEVARRDPVVKAQPAMIVDRGSYLEVRRTGDRCAALEGGVIAHGALARYHCTIYEDRPRTCRDFTLGSAHCLTARRRVGLSL